MTDVPDPEQPPRDRPGRRGLLEAVAEQLAELSGDVTKLKTNGRGNAELLAESLTRLRGLEETVATLAGRVDVLAEVEEDDTGRLDPAVLDALGLAAKPGIPWCWPAMDAKTARAAWVQLARFVGETLCTGHNITRGQLPDCWPAHPHVVDTLSWLRATYRAARVGKAPAAAAAEWSQRWLPGAWKVIADGMPGSYGPNGDCAPGRHAAPFRVRQAFEQVRQWEQHPPRPQSPEMQATSKMDSTNPEHVARQHTIVQQVSSDRSPWRARIMDLDEALDRDPRVSHIPEQQSRRELWLPIWREIAAADVARRHTPPEPDRAYDL